MAKSVFTKHKLLRYFIFLFVIVAISIGVAIGCYLYFGHAVNSTGLTEDFNDKLIVGKSFSTDDILKDQKYNYSWIKSSDVEVTVYVNTIKDGVEAEEANTEILNYKPDAKSFEVCGVATGYIDFRSNLDSSVSFQVPFATKFNNDDTNTILRENNPEFFDDDIVTSSEIKSIKEVRITNPRTYNISELNVCTNLNRFILASEEIIYFTGIDAINSNVPFYVTDGAYDDYMVDSDWDNYANRVFPIVDLQEGMHTVVFEFNGGQLPSISPNATKYYISVQEGETVNIEDYTLEHAGYTFNGWFTSNDNGLTLTDNRVSGNYLFSSDLKLYAKWSVNHYKVIYNDEHITNLPKPIEAEYGKTYSISSQKLERVGYTFWGWATTQNAQDAEYVIGQEITNLTASDKAVINLYAVWTTNRYTLTYNGNGGVGIPESVDDIDFDFEFNISNLVPTRKGFTFLGWNADSTAEVAQYLSGEKVKGLVAISGGRITLYAVWAVHKYNINYDANGGTGAPTAQLNIEYGQTFSLSSVKPNRTGYVFLGWSTNQSAKEATYEAEQTVSSLTEQDGDTILLYAVWAANTYTIVYNANGGSNAPSSQTNVTFANPVNLSSSIPTKTGCTFVGWATEPDATEAKYVKGQTVKSLVADDDGKFTLYAVWAVNSYSIAYNANGGTNAPTEQSNLMYGEAVTLSAQEPIRTGYLFLGWARTTTATEAQYSAGQEVSNLVSNDGGTLTLYAVWAATSYTIIYNANGGQNPPASVSGIPFEETRNLSDKKPTRTGHTFLGWSTDSNATKPQFEAGSEVKQLVSDSKGNVTLYAVWSAHKYSIKYDANGGTNAPATQSNVVYDTNVNLSNSVPQRKGYHFTGWALSGSGPVVYAAGQSVKNLITEDEGSITLYAKYDPNNFKIVYDVNGGQNAPSSTLLIYDAKGTITTSLPEKKDGNFQCAEFVGWAFTSNATAINYAKGAQLTEEAVNSLYDRCSNGEIKLYAVWEQWYKITLDTDGANINGVTHGAYYKYNLSITVSISYTRDKDYNFTFDGSSKGNVTSYTFNMPKKNITLKASSNKSSCVATGTLITLSDYTQVPVESLKVGDIILAWDFTTQSYVETDIVIFTYHGTDQCNVVSLNFADGNTLKIIGDHTLFDMRIHEYVQLNELNAKTYIGHEFLSYNEHTKSYSTTELVSVQIEKEYVGSYSIVTSYYFNYISDNIVSSSPCVPGIYELLSSYIQDDFTFNRAEFESDLAEYGLYDYELFSSYMTYEQFEKLCGPYFKIAIGKGLTTWEMLITIISANAQAYQ